MSRFVRQQLLKVYL